MARGKRRLTWSPLYWSDFLTDHLVLEMTNEELGAYIRLLGAQWFAEGRGLNPDQARLRVAAQVPESRWPSVWKTLEQHFTRRRWKDRRRRNPRLHEEWSRAVAEYDRSHRGGTAPRKEESSTSEILNQPSKSSGQLDLDDLTCKPNTEAAGDRESPDTENPKPAKIEPAKSAKRHVLDGLTSNHPDADEDEGRKRREKIADAKPSAPAPPISDPLSPPGPPTADDGLPVHDPPRTSWPEFVGRWNELAAAEGLPKIGGALSEGRKRKARAVMAAMRKRGLDWFEVLAGAVRDRRGGWARGMRFPTLDQACREEIVDKLAEGFYEHDRQASSGQPEHLNRQSDFKPTKGPTRIKIIRPEDRRR